MKTIAELESILEIAEETPRTFFGADEYQVDVNLRLLLKDCHPDHFSTDADKADAERIFKRFSTLADSCRVPPVTIKSKTRSYMIDSLLAVGDVSDVHLSTSGVDQYVLKMSRIAGADKLLAHEHFVLRELQDKAGDSSYKYYFPSPVETIKAQDGMRKQINVFFREDGGFTLEQVIAKHPNGLKGEHLAWIYKRLLTGIGFSHRCNWIHNAVLPCHIVIYPGTHGVQLLDWKFASPPAVLKSISAKYRDWYPLEVTKKQPTNAATDIYMASRCMLYAAGGSVANGFPSSVPRQMISYFNSAMFESQKMRPQDAWQYLDEFTDMLAVVYGKPVFHSLSMA